MKIATGNRLNEFWEELKGVLVPKSKVLKTLEEIEANTNEENIAGATALKAVNNNLKFPDGVGFYPDTKNGVRGYNTDAARGADTFCPFKLRPTVKTYNCTYTGSNGASVMHFVTSHFFPSFSRRNPARWVVLLCSAKSSNCKHV